MSRKGAPATKHKQNIVILITSMFLVAIGYTMVIPFLPLYLLEMGVPDDRIALWSGLVFSICFFVAAIMGPIWGKMADTKGKKKMAIRAAVLLGFSYLFCGLSQNEYQLLGARAFQGFANGFVAASMAIISVSADPKKLGATLGMGQTALVVGGIAGPLVGGVLAHLIGMRNSFYISAAFLWVVALLVILYVKEIGPSETKKAAQTSIFKDLSYAYGNTHLREILVIAMCLQTTILMIQPVTALYVGKLLAGYGNVELISGIIMSSGGFAGALTTTLWGKFGQTKGYYFAISLTLLAAGAITMAQAIPDSIIGFGICQFLVGCFVIGTNPSLNAAMVMYTPDDFRGRVFGLFNTAQQAGNMCGPLASAAISMASGIWEVYAAAGVVQLLLGVKVYMSHVRKGEMGKP